jgi:phage I-like protein
MKTDEDIDIIVEEEVEAVDSVEEVAEQPHVPDIQESISELKRQINAEREARVAAERRAHAASNEKDETEIQLVSSAIDNIVRDTEILKSNYQIAMQNQDFSGAADIQQLMGEKSAQLLQLQNGLKAMTSKPKEPEPQYVPTDPVEAFASRLSATSAEWVRKNPQFVTDPRLNRKMIRAHEDAVDDGIAVDTPAYFAAIEAKLGVAKTSETNDQHAAKVTQRRDAAPAAAPVSRGTGTGSKNVVRLTAAEREAASDMGMSEKEYATQKMILIKEGKLK